MDLWGELTELYFKGCNPNSLLGDSIPDTYAVISSEIDFLQAKIDKLMLEYCPDEMTEAQVSNWALHQKLVTGKPVMEKL
jgi:hypothetical protein